MNNQQRNAVHFQAAQGSKKAQAQLSGILASEGKVKLAAFWDYKAKGGAAFTVENWERETGWKYPN